MSVKNSVLCRKTPSLHTLSLMTLCILQQFCPWANSCWSLMKSQTTLGMTGYGIFLSNLHPKANLMRIQFGSWGTSIPISAGCCWEITFCGSNSLHHNFRYLLVHVPSAHYWVLLLSGFFQWGCFLWRVCGLPHQGRAALLGHLLLATDPAAILGQGVLNLEDNRCTQIRNICIKCMRNLLPQIGKGKMKQKASSAVRSQLNSNNYAWGWAKHS